MVKEVANVIWKHYSIYEACSLDVAVKRFQLLRKIIDEELVSLESELKYLDEAFEIATQNNISVYGVLYIAQAIIHNTPLVTSDKRQTEVAEKLKLEVIHVP